MFDNARAPLGPVHFRRRPEYDRSSRVRREDCRLDVCRPGPRRKVRDDRTPLLLDSLRSRGKKRVDYRLRTERWLDFDCEPATAHAPSDSLIFDQNPFVRR